MIKNLKEDEVSVLFKISNLREQAESYFVLDK